MMSTPQQLRAIHAILPPGHELTLAPAEGAVGVAWRLEGSDGVYGRGELDDLSDLSSISRTVEDALVELAGGHVECTVTLAAPALVTPAGSGGVALLAFGGPVRWELERVAVRWAPYVSVITAAIVIGWLIGVLANAAGS